MSVEMEVKKRIWYKSTKKQPWYKYAAIAGLCVVVYQSAAIAVSLSQHYNLALILYTFEIIALVVLAGGCVLLLKRVNKE